MAMEDVFLLEKSIWICKSLLIGDEHMGIDEYIVLSYLIVCHFILFIYIAPSYIILFYNLKSYIICLSYLDPILSCGET